MVVIFVYSLSVLNNSRFYVIFTRFAGSDVLIQCMPTTAYSLLNQTLCWSNVALEFPNALPEEYQSCFFEF